MGIPYGTAKLCPRSEGMNYGIPCGYEKKYNFPVKNSIDTLDFLWYSKKCTIMERYAFSCVM